MTNKRFNSRYGIETLQVLQIKLEEKEDNFTISGII